ncbi:MAG: hypothetical protein GX797_07495 [Chloroflexi bacterium]|jgi:cell division protein FtsB|nr:hypothetical protein [Chloroflexota bacterium]
MSKLWEKIKKFNWLDRNLITIIVIVVLVFLMMDFNNRMTTMIRLNNEEAGLQTRIAELEATQVKLEDQIAYATSEIALEEWARESNRMIEEGDHPIILLQPGDYKPQPTHTAQPETVTRSRLDIWKELLFGSSDAKP